ncbi:MAG TPA: 5-oxoprolinase subunit PxpB, partial [Pseudomonadota bacterium]|nr:5-oxoprolinase subunit PxpB [Pseudomonadota bacterium]
MDAEQTGAQPYPRCLAAGDQAVLVELGDSITPALNLQVRRLCAAVQRAAIPGVIDLHPAYASVLIRFDPLRLRRPALLQLLTRALAELDVVELPPARRVELPVCYGGPAGPDLEQVAAHSGLSPAGVIELHSAALYLVYFLGFAPGFAYLGGLPAALQTPRLETPRPLVPAGSVGIAGRQTGVYPLAIPGGWRLIGRTSRVPFDPLRTPSAPLQPGGEENGK